MTTSSSKRTSFDLSRAYPIGCTLNTAYTVTGIICSTVRYNLYRARDRRTGRNVTVKELTRAKIAKEIQADLFQSEIRALNRARHANLPLMLDHFSDRGNLYIVFEHVTGMCLGEMLSAEGPMTAELVYPIFLEIAAALSAAHEAGVIHNELTPSCIFLLGDTDSSQIAKLIDFGGATILDDSGPQQKHQSFRPEYSSPESLKGEPTDARSDIYSIGVILYTALTGRLPFACQDVNELIRCQMSGLPRRFKEAAPELDIPFHVEATVFKCLAKNKEDRFQSAKDLAKWLRSWRHNSQTVEPEPPRTVAPADKAYTVAELNNIGTPKVAFANEPAPVINPPVSGSVKTNKNASDSDRDADARQKEKQERDAARAEAKALAREHARMQAEERAMQREAEKLQERAFKRREVPVYLIAAVMVGVIGFIVTVNVRHAINAKDAEREVFNMNKYVPERTRNLIAAKEQAVWQSAKKIEVPVAEQREQDVDSQLSGNVQAQTDSSANAISNEQSDAKVDLSNKNANDSNAVNQEAPEVPVKPGEPVNFEGESGPAPAQPTKKEEQHIQKTQRSSGVEGAPNPERYASSEPASIASRHRHAYQTSYTY